LTSLDCAALVAEARTIDIQIGGTGICLANPSVQKLAKHLMKDQDEDEVKKKILRRIAHEPQDHVAGNELIKLLADPYGGTPSGFCMELVSFSKQSSAFGSLLH